MEYLLGKKERGERKRDERERERDFTVTPLDLKILHPANLGPNNDDVTYITSFR